MSIIARLGVSVGLSSASLAMWESKDSQNNTLSRVFHIMSKFQKNPKIKDPYTSRKHIDSATSLLSKTTENSPETFRYSGQFIPETPEQAKDKVLLGNYIRCPSRFQLPNQSVDVIVTETTEPKICQKFQHDALRDLALRAARIPLDKGHPCADIPVYERSSRGFQHTGNLTNMPSTTRTHIAGHNFKVCPNYCGGQVVIAGDKRRNACHDLFEETRLNLPLQ